MFQKDPTAGEKAFKAVKEFNRLAPSLTRYARAMAKSTGDPNHSRYKVEAGGTTRTNGRTIYVRPSLDFAVQVNHDQFYCDQRDDKGVQLCRACAKWEHLYFGLYHEISHCVNGSFEPLFIQPKDIGLIKKLLGKIDGLDDEHSQELIKRIRNVKGIRFGFSGDFTKRVYPGIESLDMMTEDIRIDEIASQQRPGVREMRHWQTVRIVNEGIETDDGSRVFWSTAPLESQIALGVLFLVNDIELKEAVSEEAADIVNKIDAMGLVEIPNGLSEAPLYAMAIGMAACHLTGGKAFPFTDEEREQARNNKDGDSDSGSDGDEPDQGDGGTGDDEQGADGDSGGSSGDQGSQGTPATSEEVLAALKKIMGHDHEDEKKTPEQKIMEADLGEAMNDAVNQIMNFDSYSIDVSGLILVKDDSSQAFRHINNIRASDTITKADARPFIASALAKARKVFGDSKLDKYERNQKSGRVAGRSLYKFNMGDERLFQKRHIAEGIEFDVILGLDCSGSTGSGPVNRDIREIAFYTAELLNKVGVNFAIYGHTTRPGNGKNYAQEITEIKSLRAGWNDRAQERLNRLKGSGGSLDGHNIEFYRKVVQNEGRGRKKLIIYFTDGQIPEQNRIEEVEIINREIDICRKDRIGILGVGVRTDSPKRFGLDTILVKNGADLKTIINEIEKRIV